MNKIQLPNIIKSQGAKAHPFPIQVGIQTQRFIQGSIFYFTFTDEVVGLYFRTVPDGYSKTKALFSGYGYSDSTWETSWSCFEEYLRTFSKPVFRSALIAMKSHWDWYIDKIGQFIVFARQHVTSPQITNSVMREFDNISQKSITDQFKLLEKLTGLTFDFDSSYMEALHEMALVRNLGIHNQWTVNKKYKKWSIQKDKWEIGQLRDFTITELENWSTCLQQVIHDTAFPIAIRFVSAPDYKG